MKLAITVGLPYAGKSAFCRYLNSIGETKFVIVCPDTVRTAILGDLEVQRTVEPHIWAITQTMVRHFLLQGCNVIVDATNLTKDSRRMWVDIAAEFKIPLDMYWVNTAYTICRHENEERGYIPKKAFERMADTMDYPDYLEIKHGDIYYVTRTKRDKEAGSFGKLVKKDKA
jgi:predicted kinase